MANHFNDLLLETLKDIHIRLERVESRVDHIMTAGLAVLGIILAFVRSY